MVRLGIEPLVDGQVSQDLGHEPDEKSQQHVVREPRQSPVKAQRGYVLQPLALGVFGGVFIGGHDGFELGILAFVQLLL